VFVWVPEKDGVRCMRHDMRFAKGGACPACFSDPPPAEADEERSPHDRAATSDLPATHDHERAFIRMAELAEDWAIAEEAAAARWVPDPGGDEDSGSMKEGPSRSIAAKLLDTAIKARRAAHACARQREDWENTERVEKSARALGVRH